MYLPSYTHTHSLSLDLSLLATLSLLTSLTHTHTLSLTHSGACPSQDGERHLGVHGGLCHLPHGLRSRLSRRLWPRCTCLAANSVCVCVFGPPVASCLLTPSSTTHTHTLHIHSCQSIQTCSPPCSPSFAPCLATLTLMPWPRYVMCLVHSVQAPPHSNSSSSSITPSPRVAATHSPGGSSYGAYADHCTPARCWNHLCQHPHRHVDQSVRQLHSREQTFAGTSLSTCVTHTPPCLSTVMRK